jgi:multiple sugar transport system permease protein
VGRALIAIASLGGLLILLVQILHTTGTIGTGFTNWRPIPYAYLVWSVALGIGQVLIRGQRGLRALFLLPAVLFTVAVVIFPTLFGFYIASLDWNLSSLEGPHFNGLDNLITLFNDTYYWNALGNMVFYTLAVLAEYAIAFALALLLNADIRARKFFRVVFLLPLALGWDNPAFFAHPWIARVSINAMDAWVSIPFIMIILLAGLQAMPKEVLEAAKVDGANGWQSFWHVTFPIMLPVSVTVLIIRIIFKLKLADIVINVTAGGPGGATDTVSSFIYRVYRDRSNVGYGTGLAIFYLLLIIVFLTVLLRLTSRWMQKVA